MFLSLPTWLPRAAFGRGARILATCRSGGNSDALSDWRDIGSVHFRSEQMD
jgi:hypothetical protein